MTIDTDRQLLNGLRKGYEDAFVELFNRYGRMMYALAYRYLKSEEDAEDAVQSAFMKLWARRESLELNENIGSLLYTILKNHVLNEIRHNAIVVEGNWEMSREAEEADDSFIRQMEKKNQLELLISAVSKLPARKRDICLLKLMKGFTNKEIAEQLNIKVPTVKVHYNQAIRMLRKYLLVLVIAICAFGELWK